MVVKLIAPIIIFIILVIEKLFPKSLSEKKWTKWIIFVLLIIGLVFNVAIIISDDSKNTEKLDNQGKAQNLLINKNDSLMVLMRDFESNSDSRSLILNSRIDELNSNLEPFIKLAVKKYPNMKIEDALVKIHTELAETKKMAKPNSINFNKKEIKKIDEGYSVKLFFSPTKNESLGIIVITAEVVGENSAKIIDIWPSTDGGAFTTGKNSKEIILNGKAARIQYSPLGSGYSAIEIKVSTKCRLNIKGNNELKEFSVDITN